jgi:hypothetical protein
MPDSPPSACLSIYWVSTTADPTRLGLPPGNILTPSATTFVCSPTVRVLHYPTATGVTFLLFAQPHLTAVGTA